MRSLLRSGARLKRIVHNQMKRPVPWGLVLDRDRSLSARVQPIQAGENMLLIRSSFILRAVLIVFAALWINEVAARLRSDVLEFKTSTDPIAKLTIGFWWLLTVLVIWWLIQTLVGMAASIF